MHLYIIYTNIHICYVIYSIYQYTYVYVVQHTVRLTRECMKKPKFDFESNPLDFWHI